MIAQLVKKKKKSTCNAGDPSLIPGSGRSLGEGTGYPLQYSWASLGLILDSDDKESTCNARYLGSIPGLGRSPGEGKVTHSSIPAWRIPWTVVHGVAKSQTGLSDFHSHRTPRLPRTPFTELLMCAGDQARYSFHSVITNNS